jgi:hypothetical protein
VKDEPDGDGELGGDRRRPNRKAHIPPSLLKRTFFNIPQSGGKFALCRFVLPWTILFSSVELRT